MPMLQRDLKVAVLIEDVRQSAAHAGGEVAPGLAQHDDGAARHVLAAVVADAFDDRGGAAVADREALTRHPAHEDLAAGRTVERDVTDDDVVLGLEGRFPGRTHRHESARQTLAEIVVRIAFEIERDSRREPRSKTLARRPLR